nr:MAG TPA: hypothetical protein [Caudoviricetes sp.]
MTWWPQLKAGSFNVLILTGCFVLSLMFLKIIIIQSH